MFKHCLTKWMIAVPILYLLGVQVSYSSAFSLYTEANGEAVGNYAAGIAAEAADASTGWYNPAGLALLHDSQVVLSSVGVMPYAQLSGNTTYRSENFFDPSSPFFYQENFSNLQGANRAVIPALHIARPVGPTTTFGLSVVSPFGLSTDWSPTSAIRYAGTFSKLLTVDVSPEVGGRLTALLDGGMGLDLESAVVTFNGVIGSPAVMSSIDYAPHILDSQSQNTGNSFGIGFHAGLLLHLHENHTRIGVNYQAPIQHQFRGTSELTGRLADPNLNAAEPLNSNEKAISASQLLYSNPISLPSITTLSLYRDYNEKLAFLASAVYTTWSSFQNIQLFNIAAAAANPETLEIRQVTVDVVTEEHYRDTWRLALGANYHVNDRLMLRLGGGVEQTPTNNIDRNIRLPDANRVAACMGAHYQIQPSLGLDVGYTHLFFQHTFVNKTDIITTSSFHVNADVQARADLVGGQLVWLMD